MPVNNSESSQLYDLVELPTDHKSNDQISTSEPLPQVVVLPELKEKEDGVTWSPQEKQAMEKKLLFLTTQLARSQIVNTNLIAQIEDLNGQLITQMTQIKALQEQKIDISSLSSESELLQTIIQRQPTLLPMKKEKDKKLLAAKSQKKPKDAFSGAVEFGFSYAQDNQVVRSVNGSLILNYEQPDLYKLNSNFKLAIKEEDGERSAEKYRWQLQGDYYLDPSNLVFARSDMQRNQFASYEKEDTYTIGYGRIIFAQDKHKFNIEVGPGYRIEVPNVDEDEVYVDEMILRTNLNYERAISESLQIKVSTVWEMGNENSIYSATFKAQNKIYRELYLIFGSEYKYTQNVPVDTLRTEFSTGLNLMYAF